MITVLGYPFYPVPVPVVTDLNLAYRGYSVRIGTGTIGTSVTTSNAWPAHVHIPVHSNARYEGNSGCQTTDPKPHGAVVIYQSSAGKLLAEEIIRQYAPRTPGTRDYACNVKSSCTAFNSLYELRKTRAVAAYLEREFHTWNKGAEFLNRMDDYVLLAEGVDRFLGYPRGN